MKKLALLALLVLCVFTTVAVAEAPNNEYYAHHLTVAAPTTNGPATLRLNEKTTTVAAEEGAYILTAKAFAEVPNHLDTLVHVNLVKNADGAWVLSHNPLSVTFAADGLPVSTARQAAPSTEELAALITAAGLCGHAETAVDLAECTAVAVHANSAIVTFNVDKIAEKLGQTHGGDHVVGQLSQAVVTYTVDDKLVPTHVKVAFDIECPETIFTVIYKDGVDGKVFRSRIITVKNGSETPAFPMDSDPVRKGYDFLGWAPEVQDFVLADAIYEAQWTPTIYNITYVGIPADAENPNPATYTIEDETIVFADAVTDGFLYWTPDSIPAGSTGDVTVTATVVPKPVLPKMGTNVAPDMMQFQCTRCEEHSWTTSTAFSANSGRTYWNYENKRWETFVYARTSLINTTQTRKNYFGNYNHPIEDTQSVKHYLYFEPDAQGETSLGAPVTGQWFAVEGNPIMIYVTCLGEPTPFTASNMPSIGNALWARNCTNTKNYVRYNSVKNDITSISEMTKDDAGNFWMTVTVSGDAAVAAFQAKYGTEYVACDGNGNDGHVSAASGHGAYAGSYDFVFKYPAFSASSTIDYSKNNWKFDAAATIALGQGYARLNGYYIWMSRDFTVTYTDGVEDADIFADAAYTVREGSATPAFEGTLEREGYAFAGWTPAVAATVTADVTYTATWEKVWNITYDNVPDGVENPNPTTYLTSETPITLADIVAEGFIGWDIPTIEEGTTGDLTISALYLNKPTTIPKPSTVADGYGTIQCVTHGEHVCDDSAMLSSGNSRLHTWNYDLKRWETPCSVRVSLINSTVTRKNYFGNVYHYNLDGSDLKNQSFDFFWNPDTQKWEAASPILVNVWCTDEPLPFTADSIPSIGNALWVRDCTNTKNYVRYNSITSDVTSISEMTKDDAGNFWMTVTVSGDAAVAAFQAKFPGYVICSDASTENHDPAAAGHGAYAGSYQFVFKYAKIVASGSMGGIDYTKNNWKFDSAATVALGQGYARLNGYYIWMCPTAE